MPKAAYSAMVERNRRVNREKEERVIAVIHTMVEEEDKVLISRVSRRCQVSRSFFYTNAAVAAALREARILQADLPDPPRGSAVSVAALQKLEDRIREKDARLAELEKENTSLRRKLKKSDIRLLKIL